jgi:AraC-like DNA-binding protein
VSAEATAAQLLVFNPVEPHAGHMRNTRFWKYRGLYLARPAIDSLLATLGIGRLPGFTRNAFFDPRLIRDFARVHAELDEGHPGLARERLIDACGRLFAQHSRDNVREPQGRADRTHVRRTLETIRARFREQLGVEDLAAAVGLSPFQLIRQFNRSTGMPPHAHVLTSRLHYAIHLMRHGAALADAATGAGFYDQSALTRHFRRAYGITPGQYVRALPVDTRRNFRQDTTV